MPNPTYPIILQDATPESTPLGELAKLIGNLNVSIMETAHAHNIELPEDEAVVSLVDVRDGSNRLVLSLAPFLLDVLAEITASVTEGDFAALPVQAHTALHEISHQATRQNWRVVFSEHSEESSRIREAEISAAHPVPKPRPQFVRGTTTIFGMCIRVGGKVPKVDLVLSNRDRVIHVEVTREIAIRLSRSLYKNVALHGVALWDPETWELVEFKGTQIANHTFRSPVDAFEELSHVVGESWKEIDDVVDFVSGIRSSGGGQ